MPEIRGSDHCPVLSFTTYHSSLSADSNKLFQQAKFNSFRADKKEWFGPGPVGQNTLDSFVSKLATKCGLGGKGYTNHSLRVTAITLLSRNNFSNKQIMSEWSQKYKKFSHLPKSKCG